MLDCPGESERLLPDRGGWSRSFCIVRIGPKPEKKFRGNKPLNDIQIFKNYEFGSVRVIERDNEPWFVAADVCRALEIKDTWNALVRLDDDEKGTDSVSTPGGNQEMSIVNEYGLYNLILGSRKPEAKAFKRWITHEVIPSIRKHGNTAIRD